jgi:hypothetical protein
VLPGKGAQLDLAFEVVEPEDCGDRRIGVQLGLLGDEIADTIRSLGQGECRRPPRGQSGHGARPHSERRNDGVPARGLAGAVNGGVELLRLLSRFSVSAGFERDDDSSRCGRDVA